MRAVAILAFLAGLVLAVRVMFFGVQRRLDETHLAHRRWPLSLAALLMVAGLSLYGVAAEESRVTWRESALVVLMGLAAGAGAWWLVQRSAATPSSDPEDDPRYRFQGHVARVIETIGMDPEGLAGRVTFEFDGKRHDLRALWAVEGVAGGAGSAGSEVVIERVEGDVAYVEPWTAVEQRL